MKIRLLIIAVTSIILSVSCTQKQVMENANQAKGKLFIIGGGKRPVEMIKTLTELSGTDSSGYIIVLPMASGNPDTAAFYSTKQFKDLGLGNVFSYNFQEESDMTIEKLDSVRNASLIYISGGNQNKFMNIVKDTKLYTAIHEAFQKGAVISGTSAGAAVMSKKMITGNEKKYPEYTGRYRTIEEDNIEIGVGMGFVDNAIIDQHFVKRMRMNRLMTAVLENPQETCIGIDESTAIYVDGNKCTVYGKSQVILMNHRSGITKVSEGLLGGQNVELSIFLPGDTFMLK